MSQNRTKNKWHHNNERKYIEVQEQNIKNNTENETRSVKKIKISEILGNA